MYDRIRRKWAGVVTFAQDTPSTSTQGCHIFEPARTELRPSGWALRSATKRPSSMSEKAKAFLEKRLEEGARTGKKSDPMQIAKEMKTIVTEDGQPAFLPEEWITAQQISSLFSRLTAAQRQRGIDIGEIPQEDMEAAESEMALKELRSLVMIDMERPNHPIVV